MGAIQHANATRLTLNRFYIGYYNSGYNACKFGKNSEGGDGKKSYLHSSF